MISASYSNGCVEGDFLPYEGNAFTDFRLTGFGQYSIPSAGTLFGKVQYARGRHKNIGWNAMRHPELYLPYIATDSIGGDFHFEDYHVEGGYAFSLGNWHLEATGFSGVNKLPENRPESFEQHDLAECRHRRGTVVRRSFADAERKFRTKQATHVVAFLETGRTTTLFHLLRLRPL